MSIMGKFHTQTRGRKVVHVLPGGNQEEPLTYERAAPRNKFIVANREEVNTIIVNGCKNGIYSAISSSQSSCISAVSIVVRM